MNTFTVPVLSAIAVTAIAWGVYGPLLFLSGEAMHHARFKAFTLVGLSYLILAVVLPLILIYGFNIYGERDQEWTTGGVWWGLAAGAAGAIGALGIIVAFGEKGHPGVVMPIVFGCAPVVNAIVYTTMRNKWGAITSPYIIGMVLVAIGAVMVLYFTPPADRPPQKPDHAAGETTPEAKPGDPH